MATSMQLPSRTEALRPHAVPLCGHGRKKCPSSTLCRTTFPANSLRLLVSSLYSVSLEGNFFWRRCRRFQFGLEYFLSLTFCCTQWNTRLYCIWWHSLGDLFFLTGWSSSFGFVAQGLGSTGWLLGRSSTGCTGDEEEPKKLLFPTASRWPLMSAAQRRPGQEA